MTIDVKQLRTLAQAAKALPHSEAALRARIQREELNVVRIGPHVYIEEAELLRAFGDLYKPAPTK